VDVRIVPGETLLHDAPLLVGAVDAGAVDAVMRNCASCLTQFFCRRNTK
jgi:hypothetical protein